MRGREGLRPAPSDAALSLGVTLAGTANGVGGGTRRLLGGALLTAALAVTSLAPALLVTPTLETRTVAPRVLILADEPGDGLARAAALASRGHRRQSDRPRRRLAGPLKADRHLDYGALFFFLRRGSVWWGA